MVVFHVDLEERRPLGDAACDQRLRQRIFDVLLQRPAQRPRAVGTIRSCLLDNPALGVVGHRDRDRLVNQIYIQLLHQKLEDLHQVGIVQRGEDDDLVQTVQELRIEGALDLALHQLFHLVEHHVFLLALETQPLPLLQMLGSNIRGHDNDRILIVDRVAQTIGQLTIFKHLQQQVEDVRMSLLDLVQQHHAVRIALDAFRQLSALFVAHVSRRRTDQLAH